LFTCLTASTNALLLLLLTHLWVAWPLSRPGRGQALLVVVLLLLLLRNCMVFLLLAEITLPCTEKEY
jgi:hypothetical protein